MKDDPVPTAQKDAKPADNKESKDVPVVYALSPPQPEPVAAHLVLPEIKVFVHLLITQFVVDQKAKEESIKSFTSLKKLLDSYNRRTLDHFSARVYYLWSLVYERVGQLANIRDDLLLAHRTAALQHNDPGTASLIIAILRNYLHYNLFEQAAKFHDKAPFPAGRTNNEMARYLYYQGRIEAVQLRYSDAYTSLSQAIRKAPVKSALGFRQRANKLVCIVQLLMGDIPERALFRQADVKRSLKPYFRLTQAVRVGDVAAFRDVQSKFKEVFVRDGTLSLIVRLYQNVIKTGLRKINLSYSRISIKDIIQKLNMHGMEKKSEDAEKDMEYIVAKAIHDGVIDAVIDHKGKFVYSKENIDIYSTNEPQAAFHKRIRFCMDVHNEAVKAMQFPHQAYKPKVEFEAFLDDEDDLESDSKEKPSLDEDH
jgi:26S proteasome regulatory subunit N3